MRTCDSEAGRNTVYQGVLGRNPEDLLHPDSQKPWVLLYQVTEPSSLMRVQGLQLLLCATEETMTDVSIQRHLSIVSKAAFEYTWRSNCFMYCVSVCVCVYIYIYLNLSSRKPMRQAQWSFELHNECPVLWGWVDSREKCGLIILNLLLRNPSRRFITDELAVDICYTLKGISGNDTVGFLWGRMENTTG